MQMPTFTHRRDNHLACGEYCGVGRGAWGFQITAVVSALRKQATLAMTWFFYLYINGMT